MEDIDKIDEFVKKHQLSAYVSLLNELEKKDEIIKNSIPKSKIQEKIERYKDLGFSYVVEALKELLKEG